MDLKHFFLVQVVNSFHEVLVPPCGLPSRLGKDNACAVRCLHCWKMTWRRS